jgi:hypothetical protein
MTAWSVQEQPQARQYEIMHDTSDEVPGGQITISTQFLAVLHDKRERQYVGTSIFVYKFKKQLLCGIEM